MNSVMWSGVDRGEERREERAGEERRGEERGRGGIKRGEEGGRMETSWAIWKVF